MKPEGTFVAERAIAQHCPELLRRTRQASNPLKELSRLGAGLSEPLERGLAGLCSQAAVRVQVGEPVELQADAESEEAGEPLLNRVIAVGPKEIVMIASLPCRAIFGLVDLALGGSGKDFIAPVGKLPLSAQLMFGRFEQVLTSVLVDALGLAGPDSVKPRGSGVAPETRAPFAGSKRTVLPVEVTVGGGEPWMLELAFSGATAAALFAGRGTGSKTARPASAQPSLNPRSGAFGAVPLSVRAVLVDMSVPVSLLSTLKPGAVLPVSVVRSVPLAVGGQVIAYGAVGSNDEHAALQLTNIASNKEK